MWPDPAPSTLSRIRLRVLQWCYDVLYAVLVVLGSPLIIFKIVTSRRWRAGLAERLGRVERRESEAPAIWIHGVSAGEALAARELISLIDAEMPWVEVVVSTTTLNGHAAAVAAYPGKRVVYYPLDFSFSTRRVVERLRPSVVLLMELELWPNFLLTTSLRGLPVLVANGRMSADSARNYKLLQTVIPEPMTRVLHYCVQSDEYAARFQSLGVPSDRITITGSMKFDNVADELPAELRERHVARLGVRDGDFIVLGGSTHGGEDEVLIDALEEIRKTDRQARLVLVPRHPKRLREVTSVVASRGYEPVLLSSLTGAWPAAKDSYASIVVGDTMGELSLLYAVADLVFVGGSLTDRGGQNMMEPAGSGKPVVVGPNTWNFRDPMDLLLSRSGIVQVDDADAVRASLVELHGDPARRDEIGRRARGICLESKGATRRILDILVSYVPASGPRSGGDGSGNAADATN